MFTPWGAWEQFVWLAMFILAGAYIARQAWNQSEHGDRRD